MADCPKKAQPTITSQSQSSVGNLPGETPLHKLYLQNEQLPQNIVSELISNPRTKGIDAKNIDIKYNNINSKIISSNDGKPFTDSNNITNCVLSRKTKGLNDYDINDTSMYDEGLKFIIDICNEASIYSIKDNILSCVKVYPNIWYQEDNYPRPTGTSDTVSIKQYDFDTRNNSLTPDEIMIKQEFDKLRLKDTMNVVFDFNIRPDKLKYQEDDEINRSLEYKFCDEKTNITCNNQKIEYKPINTDMFLKAELKIFVDTRNNTKYYIKYTGVLLKDKRTEGSNSSIISDRIISLYDGFEVNEETRKYIKEIPITDKSGLYTYYSAKDTPNREKIETKLKDLHSGGMDNCSFILGEKDCLYNFNSDRIKNNSDHKKYHMSELRITFPVDSNMHTESRLFLKSITDPKKYTAPGYPQFYKIIESIRETHFKKAKENWGTKYTSINVFKCQKCREELDSSKFITVEKKEGGTCNSCRPKSEKTKPKPRRKQTLKIISNTDTDTDTDTDTKYSIKRGRGRPRGSRNGCNALNRCSIYTQQEDGPPNKKSDMECMSDIECMKEKILDFISEEKKTSQDTEFITKLEAFIHKLD